MKIIPAILESNIDSVQEKLYEVASDGRLDTVQIDILDGSMADKLTVTPYDLVGLDCGNVKLDFHLMTEDPLDYVWELAAQEGQIPVRAVAGQVERMSEQKAFLEAVKDRGWQAGLALDLDTPVDSIDDNVWRMLDQIILLAVPLGRQGQEFDEHVLSKLPEIEEMARENGVKPTLVIDGGVKPAEIGQLREYGIGEVAVGSYLWGDDYRERLDAIFASFS